MKQRTFSLVQGGLLAVAGLFGVGAGSAQAQSAATTDCSFPCFFHQAAPAPTATPAAAAIPEASSVPEPAASEPAVAKPKPKPIRALTIAAGEAEVSRLKALSGVVRGQPIKIVTSAAASEANGRADFAVTIALPNKSGAADRGEAKLFTEQLHVLAGPAVTKMQDLEGRLVSFGPEGSSSQDAARKAFQALGVSVKETPLEIDNALDGASTGDIAAVVLLAPQPSERLRSISGSQLHLLSWPEGAILPSGAVESAITAEAYPKLVTDGAPVRAMGVEAVLSISSKAGQSPAAKRFMTALEQRSPTLAKQGFDLLKADLGGRPHRKLASAEVQ